MLFMIGVTLRVKLQNLLNPMNEEGRIIRFAISYCYPLPAKTERNLTIKSRPTRSFLGVNEETANTHMLLLGLFLNRGIDTNRLLPSFLNSEIENMIEFHDSRRRLGLFRRLLSCLGSINWPGKLWIVVLC